MELKGHQQIYQKKGVQKNAPGEPQGAPRGAQEANLEPREGLHPRPGAECAEPPKAIRQLGRPGQLADNWTCGLTRRSARRLARRIIEPAEREHGGRALRETPARPNRRS